MSTFDQGGQSHIEADLHRTTTSGWSTPPPPILPKGPDPVQNLSSFLDRVLRITVSDNRYFIGRFTCTDSKLNIVLTQCEEYRPAPSSEDERRVRENQDLYYPKSQRGTYERSYTRWAKNGDGYGEEAPHREGRILGMVMIPGKEAVRIELIDEGRKDGGMGNGLI